MKPTRWFKNVIHLVALAVLAYVAVRVLIDARTKPKPLAILRSTLISGPDCSAPCWRNITPGESSEDDFLQLVDSSSADRFRSLKRNELVTAQSGSEYIWTDRPFAAGGKLLAPLGIVTQLSFRWEKRTAPAIGSVIELLGAPDAYTAHALGGESEDLAIGLFYERGVVVDVFAGNSRGATLSALEQCEFDLAEDSPVRFIHFLEPNRSALLAKRTVGLGVFEEPQAWTGLGPITLTTRECLVDLPD